MLPGATDNPERSSYTVPVLSRDEFLRQFKQEYNQGQHVTFLGPTQRGKTRLSQQMLHVVISPENPCVILAGKPPGRDSVMAGAAEKLNLRIVEEWPPTRTLRDRKRNGFVLRPHHTMTDLARDEENLKTQFRNALIGNYSSKKPVITVVDETYQVQVDMKLKREAEAALVRGAPINAEWNLAQRGKMISYLCYDAPEWIIIFQEPTALERQRYAEIGGTDPRLVQELVKGLKTYTVSTPHGKGTISEALAIRRSGSQLYIVDVR